MSLNPQSRKWSLVLNNPLDAGLTREEILNRLDLFCPDYYCVADEISTTGTPHTHIFAYSQSPSRFLTWKRRFPTAHIEKAMGTIAANRDYVKKEGKWANTDKADTVVPGSFFEVGSVPSEAEEKSPKMAQLLQALEEGQTTPEIIRNNPGFGFRVNDIDNLRETLLADRYRTENRDVRVHYIYGAPGTGKTRGIYEKHSAADVCRITDYGKQGGLRFDAYHGQPVLVFEEFHSKVPIGEMLNYLDIYPLMLPARYYDRVACYTTVYITSNVSLFEQYRDIQAAKPQTWKALLRRITTVEEYMDDGSIQQILF